MVDPQTDLPGIGNPADYFASRGMVTSAPEPPTLGETIATERKELDVKQQEIVKQYREDTQSQIDKLEAGIKARESEMATPIYAPHRPNLKPVPVAPQQQYQDPMQAFSSPAVILASLGSMFSRHPLKVAFDSATAAINSYHKGDQEALALQRENWKNAIDVAIQQNRLELEKYNEAWRETEHKVSERQARMQAIAAGNNDQVMLAALKKGMLDPYNILQLRRQQLDKLELAQVRYGANVLDDDSIESLVDRRLEGDKSAASASSLGFGMSGSENRSKFNKQLTKTMAERGITPQQLIQKDMNYVSATSGARTMGTYGTKLDAIIRSAEAAVPQAIAASDKVGRTNWVGVNRLAQTAEKNISDPNLKAFRTANLQLAELWARGMNPQGVMRESDREFALGILDTADGPEAYRTAIKQLVEFLYRERRVVEEMRAGTPARQIEIPPPPGSQPPAQIDPGAFNRFKNWLYGGGEDIPSRQDGGPVEAGKVYQVNEKGPEYFVPNQDGTVIPAHRRGEGLPLGGKIPPGQTAEDIKTLGLMLTPGIGRAAAARPMLSAGLGGLLGLLGSTSEAAAPGPEGLDTSGITEDEIKKRMGGDPDWYDTSTKFIREQIEKENDRYEKSIHPIDPKTKKPEYIGPQRLKALADAHAEVLRGLNQQLSDANQPIDEDRKARRTTAIVALRNERPMTERHPAVTYAPYLGGLAFGSGPAAFGRREALNATNDFIRKLATRLGSQPRMDKKGAEIALDQLYKAVGKPGILESIWRGAKSLGGKLGYGAAGASLGGEAALFPHQVDLQMPPESRARKEGFMWDPETFIRGSAQGAAMSTPGLVTPVGRKEPYLDLERQLREIIARRTRTPRTTPPAKNVTPTQQQLNAVISQIRGGGSP